MKRVVRLCICLLMFGISIIPVNSQSADVAGQVDVTPIPYSPEEFPQWALDVRRGEIVAAGTLPLTLLATRLVYGLVRFVVKSIQAGGLDMAYAPWFLSSPGGVPLSRDEKIIIVGSAAGVSVSLAVLDYYLGVNEAEESDSE